MIKNKRLLLIILTIFILAAAGSFFILFVDQWHIEINDGSENNVKIEYGDTYDDGDRHCRIKRPVSVKEGIPCYCHLRGFCQYLQTRQLHHQLPCFFPFLERCATVKR